MGASLIGFAIGLAVGASTGTEFGAFAGAMLGMTLGFAVYGLAWLRAHSGDEPTVERHSVMCTPFGHAAECEFEGDLGLRRWHDVKSCSLLDDPNHVDCDKGCVRQLNLARVRPTRPASAARTT